MPGDIHTRILERMYTALQEDKTYPYLMRHAQCRLEEARDSFRKSGMEGRPLIHLGGHMWALFPWLGSYAFLALERFLKLRCGKRLGLKGMNPSRPYYLQFTMQVGDGGVLPNPPGGGGKGLRPPGAGLPQRGARV